MNPFYVLLMALAMLSGGLLLRRSQAKLSLSPFEKFGLAFGAFVGAMFGAKLPFVLAADWESVLSGLAWFDHGKTILTGLTGGYLGVEAAKWAMLVRVKTGDTFAFPCAVAVAIGRLACFVGGCCFGTPTQLPWGVHFPSDADEPFLLRHPTQVYEAIFHATMAGVLFDLQKKGLFQGQLMKLYLLTYFGYRFLSEFIRPEQPLWLGLTGYQLAALALILVFAWLWRRDSMRYSTAPHDLI